MAKIKITEKDIRALEFKSGLAFRVFREVMNYDEILNPGVISSIDCLYGDLGKYLKQLALPAKEIRYFKKPGTRGKDIGKYLLQYFLMCNENTKIVEFKLDIKEKLGDGMGGLKAIINAEDEPGPGHGEVYKRIILKSKSLRAKGNFHSILRALNYVRNKYS